MKLIICCFSGFLNGCIARFLVAEFLIVVDHLHSAVFGYRDAGRRLLDPAAGIVIFRGLAALMLEGFLVLMMGMAAKDDVISLFSGVSGRAPGYHSRTLQQRIPHCVKKGDG